MIKFEPVSRFKDADLPLPTRATKNSAGYDFIVAEDVVIPPYKEMMERLTARHDGASFNSSDIISLEDMAAATKITKAKPTLVSTGMKCYLPSDSYLELSVRSSTPLKHWLILANSVGR